jgi:hypothetical protein
VDLRLRTITTATAFAAHPEPAKLAVRDEVELVTEPFPAIVPDLEAWHRATGNQGPAVRVPRPGFRPRVRGLGRPFSRFARAGLEEGGHVSAVAKLRQRAPGGALSACGPSLAHFRVDPDRLAVDPVTVREYFTFLEVMQQADVQLYA